MTESKILRDIFFFQEFGEMRETCTSLSSSITIDEYDPLAVFRFGFGGDAWHPDSHELDPANWMCLIVFLNHHFKKKQFQKNSTENWVPWMPLCNLRWMLLNQVILWVFGALGVGFGGCCLRSGGSSSAVYGLQMVDKKTPLQCYFWDEGSS